MKRIGIFAGILIAVFFLAPVLTHAAGPDIPPPPIGGVGVRDFLMSLFSAIFNFLRVLFAGLPGMPG